MNYNDDDEEESQQLEEPALKYNYFSPEEYLSFERASPRDKHELHQGRLVTMQGASMHHNRIVRTLLGGIAPHLKGQSCEVFPSDLRVYIPTAESFTYPDVSVICDQPDMINDAYLDTVKNPTVIIEVLSPSTERYDKGNKFFYYMQIAGLKEYIIISSTTLYIQAARKKADGLWQFTEITDKKAVLSIPAIQFRMPVEDVYERVKF